MRSIIYCIIILSLLLSSGCNKMTMIQNIDIITDDSLANSGNNKESYKLYFRGGTNIYSTKATGVSALQQNRFVTIYCYSYYNTFNNLVAYKSVRAGVLSPLNSEQMEVKSGVYNFYALGIANNTNKPPLFTYITSGMLYNNIRNGNDYIYCKLSNQDITVSQNISLVFSHMCSQIDISVISASEKVQIDSLSDATITPPANTNSTMSLFKGVITPSRSLMSYAPLKMNINGSSMNQILLPLVYYGDLNIKFTAYTNGNKEGKEYSAYIPLVNNSLQAGYSYSYEMVLGESILTFNNAYVKDWVEVDETGTPVIPTEV